MSKDQIRSASKALVPLLRRRGTSPAVGSGLRRAVQALDKALAAPEGNSAAATRQALSELRQCLVLMHESERPADHEQMEGTADALSFLAPLEAALPAAPVQDAPAAVAPSVFQTVVPSTVPVEPPAPARQPQRPPRHRRPVPAQPMSDTVHVQLRGLVASFDALQAIAGSPSQRLADLDAANEAIGSHLRATSWLGRERVPGIVKLSREAKEIETRLAAAAVLIHLHEPGGPERSLTVVERAAQAKKPLGPRARTMLHWLRGDDFIACANTVFAKTTCDAARALLLPLLVEHGQLSAAALLPLTEQADDDVAAAAARALAWVGDGVQATAMLSAARRTEKPARAGALLFAAAALGSFDALTEIRARIRKRQTISHAMVDALAVAGDPSDAALLLELAAEEDVDAGALLLAAASLGHRATLEALASFADRVPGEVLGEARRRIAGEDPQAETSRAPGRLFRGQAWSVARLLERLSDPCETVSAQRLLALELRVRTGVVPPSLVPRLASTTERSRAVAGWTSHYAKSNGRLDAAEWYYQGKPLPAVGGARA
jgi:hypothetical protein